MMYEKDEKQYGSERIKELKASEEKYHEVFNNAGDMISINQWGMMAFHVILLI